MVGIEPFRFSTWSLYIPCSMWVTYSIFAGHLWTEVMFKYWYGKRISCEFLRKSIKWREGCHLYHKIQHFWLAQSSWKWNWIATWTLCINLKPRNSEQKCSNSCRQKEKFGWNNNLVFFKGTVLEHEILI